LNFYAYIYSNNVKSCLQGLPCWYWNISPAGEVTCFWQMINFIAKCGNAMVWEIFEIIYSRWTGIQRLYLGQVLYTMVVNEMSQWQAYCWTEELHSLFLLQLVTWKHGAPLCPTFLHRLVTTGYSLNCYKKDISGIYSKLFNFVH